MEDAVGSGLEPDRPSISSIPDMAMIEPPTYVEAIDAAGGAFGGLIIGASIIMFVMGAVMLATMLQKVPEFLTALKENVMGVVVGGVVVILIATIAGYLVGKSSAQRAALMKQTSV
jgi:multisubunit Na+/H+ antiporter MnhB subunit